LNIKQRFFNWLGNQINRSKMEMETVGAIDSMAANVKIRRGSQLHLGDSPDSVLDGVPLRLSIHRANGGVVVETRTVDRAKDRVYNELFLITEDQDLGKELADIITMNNLKH
jgi:hypothetical protein